MNGVKSKASEINIGPLLFIVYINDLLLAHEELIAYADDTAVALSGISWYEAATLLGNKLDKIYSWLYENKLILNISESKFITFCNYIDSVPSTIVVKINGHHLGRVIKYRYLGITYDFNLKWDIHVGNIIKKTKYLVYVSYR